MAAPEKTTSAFPHSLDESDLADWVDKEISSLRQSVEGDASRQKAPAYDVDAESVLGPRPVIRPLVTRTSDPVASGVLRPPMALFLVLGQARRFVRRRRFDIVFYGLCIAFTIAVVLLAVSSGAR
jgi:hypothetical protein